MARSAHARVMLVSHTYIHKNKGQKCKQSDSIVAGEAYVDRCLASIPSGIYYEQQLEWCNVCEL